MLFRNAVVKFIAIFASVATGWAAAASAQVECTTFTVTNNGTSTATAVYDNAINFSGVDYDLRATTTSTTGGKTVMLDCVGNVVRVRVESAVGSSGTATVKWEALDIAGNAIILQNFFFELVDLDGPNIEYVEFSTAGNYCTDSAGTMLVTTMGATVRVEGTAGDPADNAQVNGSGATSFDVLYGVSLASSTTRWFDHGLMTGTAADLLDTCVDCGNGTVNSDEGCDDSNWVFGDGCSSKCLVEEGFACGTIGLMGSASCDRGLACDTSGGAPGICGSTCTDGTVDPDEACDDGNMIDTDACSNDCLVNLGFGTCSINIDCVDAALGIECNSGICEYGLEEGPCDGNEDCEGALVCDSNTDTCLIAVGNGTCTADSNCENANCNVGTGICDPTTCGNGVVAGLEECDDGGTTSGDGCDASCNLESGCFLQNPSFAVSQTNVGVDSPDNALGAPQFTVAGSARLRGNDTIDLFFDVTLPAGTTVTVYAATNNNSNGRMTITESTDGTAFGSPSEFNTFAANNTIEAVTYTTTSADVTHIRIARNNRRIYIDAIIFSEFYNCDTCGDGIVNVGEECDDNNSTSGDGCNDNCIVEPGVTCTGEPSVCTFPPSHTTMGALRWRSDVDARAQLEFSTVSQAGALEYRVAWGDGDGLWDHGIIAAAPLPGGGDYRVMAPLEEELFSRVIQIHEIDSSGASHLVFEGVVPEEGIRLADRPEKHTEPPHTPKLNGVSRVDSLSQSVVDSVAIHIASSGIFAVPLEELSAVLGVDEMILRGQIEAGQWGVTAEGVAVASMFDPDAQLLYVASRWREHPTSATIAHNFQPIAESRDVVEYIVPTLEVAAEPDGLFGLPHAVDPMVIVVQAEKTGPNVVSVSAAKAFEGRVQMKFESNEFPGLSAAPPLDEEFWFWQFINGATEGTRLFSHEFQTQGDDWASDTDLHLRFFVAPGLGGHVDQVLQVTLNGGLAGEVQLNTPGVQTATLKNVGALVTGANQVQIVALGADVLPTTPAGYVFVDGFSLEANGRWTSMQDAAPDSVFTAKYSTGSPDDADRALRNTVVFDLSENSFVVAADGFLPRARPAVSYLTGADNPTPALRGYETIGRDTLLDERVDHLVFAADGLESAGQQLASWRGQQGVSSRSIALPAVFDSFGAGVSDLLAVREYLLAYREQWNELPSYVVLLGAGAIDRASDPYDSYAGVPPSMVAAPDGLYASHRVLSDLDQSGIDQLHVGQIPVRSLEEALNVVEKIKHFESLGQDAWTNAPVILAAGEDRGVSFSRVIEAVASDLDQNVVRRLFNANTLLPTDVASTFLDHLEQGASWFNYIGHGSFDQFGDGLIVNRSDLASLESSLEGTGAYSFFTSMSCTTSRSEVPGFESIGEQLLKIDKGGAIGVWGPSGTSRPKHMLIMSKTLGEILADPNADRMLGKIIAVAKARALAEGVPSEEFDVFMLFGDPATKLPNLVKNVEVDPDPQPSGSGGRCAVQMAGMSNPRESNPACLWFSIGICVAVLFGRRRRTRHTF